ncbi:bifunctional DNA primase/polymerase [Streptomyces cynarae]|uniref:bifunctional DNA primase/polymerase n=1 Tax=Streptomyces cynarae TaxID=2981134 RepID=UPI0028BDD8E3|nr:bifunctional DNA primase/polymerase [Streptomyces cynarae]
MHPLAPGRKTPAANCPQCRDRNHSVKGCPCLEAGRWCHSFHAATLDPKRIDAWWAAEPSAGVGIACGPANLVVIDVDAHQASVPDRSRLLSGIPIHDSVNLEGLTSGFDTLALLAALRRQPDPVTDRDTLRVRTPSGGLHIWYRNPRPEVRFRCSTGSGKVALAWQVDVRAHGGYIVAPTTRTKDGTYQAEEGARLPAPLPGWLHDELVRTGHVMDPPRSAPALPAARRRGRSRPKAAVRALAPLLEQVAQCAAAPEGTGFTEKLNRAAYTAGGLVAAGHLDEATVRDQLLQAANCARPWQTTRNENIIDTALAAGAVRPFRLEGP